MTDNRDGPRRVSDQALEMVMRDVLDGMLEFSLDAAFVDSCASFEIIEILPADVVQRIGRQDNSDRQVYAERAEILPFPGLRKIAS